jgi:hypothetical protein
MNDTKATNRIKADIFRQLMEMSPEPVVSVEVVRAEMEGPEDRWASYEPEEYDDHGGRNHWEEEEEAYLQERETEYYRELDRQRLIAQCAAEDAREYLKAIEEFNANPSPATAAGTASTGDDL